jgi:predicted ATPase
MRCSSMRCARCLCAGLTWRSEEIELHPLGRDEVAAMVRAIFNIQRPIKADFLDLIVPLAESNPFSIEEILKALVEAGDIFYQDGR